MEGAKKVIQRITTKILNCFNSAKNTNHLTIIKAIKFDAYPLKNIFKNGSEQEPPPLNEKGSSKRTDENRSPDISNNISYFTDTNWNAITISDGTIAIAHSFSNGYEDFFKESFELYKRLFDIMASVFGLLLFAPLMTTIAIVVKLTSEGAVLFKQKRLGRHGLPFTFYKFRTMKSNSDDNIHREYVKNLIKGKNDSVNLGTDDKPFYKIKKDSRITKIGALLRKTSMDELPQLFNVLSGKMSLVGPRPPISYEVESYKSWHLRRILEVKPGITGMWQVNGRSKTTFEEMVRLDIQYIKNRSALLDIKLALKTIPAIFWDDGAL